MRKSKEQNERRLGLLLDMASKMPQWPAGLDAAVADGTIDDSVALAVDPGPGCEMVLGVYPVAVVRERLPSLGLDATALDGVDLPAALVVLHDEGTVYASVCALRESQEQTCRS